MNCPRCNSRAVGRVGADQYYCWDCCVEFAVTKKGVQVFELDDEGELVALDADGPAPQA
ncbi:MAG: hypothetical protein ACM3ZA_09065 [Bacillota bacterium]